MSVELLIGLYVKDTQMYQTYREKMGPILETYNGGFRYDFEIKKVLKSESKDKINRVFIIYFENESYMNSFITDESYLKIKDTYFTTSVSSTVEISKYIVT